MEHERLPVVGGLGAALKQFSTPDANLGASDLRRKRILSGAYTGKLSSAPARDVATHTVLPKRSPLIAGTSDQVVGGTDNSRLVQDHRVSQHDSHQRVRLGRIDFGTAILTSP